jgi:hypothetical protein
MKTIICLLALPFLSCIGTKEMAKEITVAPVNTEKTEALIESPIASAPEVKPEKEKVTVIKGNVNITITHHAPYCGGMAPSQDMLDRLVTPMSNTQYNLINLKTLEKTKVKTDSLGILYLDLGIGSYAIQELFKDCTFSEFLQQNITTSGTYSQDLGSECYKKWWKSYLGEFTIISKDELQHLNLSESESCFTGRNPCVMYTGPYPP